VSETTIHVWEKVEITLHAAAAYDNPYTEVDVWVDLEGPGFHKRVYGFWDGGNLYRVRLVATSPGVWHWTSGSSPADTGLSGKIGGFDAIPWTAAECEDNRCRRGFVRPDPAGHAFQLADGTPFYLLGDTWWATPTFRFPWHDDDAPRPFGPAMGFKDMVQYRKEQGYNSIALMAAFPNWANDGHPPSAHVTQDKETLAVRAAWKQWGTGSAKDMYNEGGRPFLFPGRVPGYEEVFPDMDRINPDYFRYMDRKLDYLNREGFIPFIEVARRDISPCWKAFHDFPESYARYVRYVFARCQANNCLLSPIHFDWHLPSIPSREYNEPINLMIEKYGPPPFGTLLGTNASPSSLVNFGDGPDAAWIGFHQLGNWREHDYYWYLEEMYRHEPALPALNGEPYYPGFPDDNPPAASVEAERNCRSGIYGSLLSGGLAGYIYGAQGLWSADIEDEAPYKIWDALAFRSGAQVGHLLRFIGRFPDRYAALEPDADLVTPNKMGDPMGYRGWAYAARTPDRNLFLVYFEKDYPDYFREDPVRVRAYDGPLPRAIVRGAEINTRYAAVWFDPRTGEWLDGQAVQLTSDMIGRLFVPDMPSDEDWALALVREA